MQHPNVLPPAVRRLRGGTPGLPRAPSGPASRRAFFVQRDYRPSSWSEFFDEKKDLHMENGDVFRVYLKMSSDASAHTLPLLVLLHGGGFSGLTWSCFVRSISELCHVNALAIDLRGHGSSKVENDDELDVDHFVSDISRILLKLYSEDDMPEIILMGHSMGGAIAIHYTDRCKEETINSRIVGLIVIDVVEGTAKDALSQMQQVLRSRPGGFKSVDYAIEWYVRSGQVKNVEAAKISMPGQIKSAENGICATDLVEPTTAEESSSQEPTLPPSSFGLSTVSETESADTAEHPFVAPANPKLQPSLQAFVWRINLSNTEKYWAEWFENLSQIFLSSKGGAKMLLLAGVDRLDGPMTVGQMQGRFQMNILPRVGHLIQEDDPDSVAQVVASYLIRNRFSVSKIEFEHPFPSC